MKKILIATMLSSIASFAYADTKAYVEGAVGWFDSKDTSSSTINTKFDSDVNYAAEIGVKDVAGTGIRIGASYTHVELDYRAHRTSNGTVAESSKSTSKMYLLNAYYDFKTGTELTPFVGLGLGMSDTDGSKDNEFVYGLHGGAQYKITNNVYIGAKGSFFRVNGLTDAQTNDRFSDHNQYSINATLGYEF